MHSERDTAPNLAPRPERPTERHYGAVSLVSSALGLLSAVVAAVVVYFRWDGTIPPLISWTFLFVFSAIGIYGGLMGFYALLAGIFDQTDRRRALLGVAAIVMSVVEFAILVAIMAIRIRSN